MSLFVLGWLWIGVKPIDMAMWFYGVLAMLKGCLAWLADWPLMLDCGFSVKWRAWCRLIVGCCLQSRG
jgi:hypothetical protein